MTDDTTTTEPTEGEEPKGYSLDAGLAPGTGPGKSGKGADTGASPSSTKPWAETDTATSPGHSGATPQNIKGWSETAPAADADDASDRPEDEGDEGSEDKDKRS